MADAEARLALTVVIPALNERETLEGCLQAIAAQDIALTDVEVLVCDGGSCDGTVEFAERWLCEHPALRGVVVHSEDGSRPGNLNTGLRRAQGRLLCRVDARSRIPTHYLRRCRELLDSRPEVSVVGGRQHTVAVAGSAVAQGIARALNNRWATGLSAYRRATRSGASDTVYLGAFRTAELRSVGGWRQGLQVNEDFDLNRRLGQRGVVWFDADLVVGYVPRASLRALLSQYTGFGRAKARYWSRTGDRPRPRQVALLVVPAFAGAGLLGTLVVAATPVRVAVLVLCALGAAYVEVAGATAPRSGVRGHVAAVIALVFVAGGWVLGAWGELARSAFDARVRRAAVTTSDRPPC